MSAPFATDDSYYERAAAPGRASGAAGRTAAGSSMFGILYGGEDHSPTTSKGGKRQLASRGRDAAPFATEPEAVAVRGAPAYAAPVYDAPPPFTKEEMDYDPRAHLMDPSYQPQYNQYSAEEELPYEPESPGYQDMPYENYAPARNLPEPAYEAAAPKYAVHHDAPWAVEKSDAPPSVRSAQSPSVKKAGDTGNKWAVGAEKVGAGHTADAAASAYAEAQRIRAKSAARNASGGLW